MAKKQQHIELKDVDGTGILKEVVIMKRWDNGSYSYIETALLDQVDKGRLKGIITNEFSDKFEVWELCSHTTLSNGVNALDYFHQLAKHHLEKGSVAAPASGLGGVAAIKNAAVIGSDFTNPSEAQRMT